MLLNISCVVENRDRKVGSISLDEQLSAAADNVQCMSMNEKDNFFWFDIIPGSEL